MLRILSLARSLVARENNGLNAYLKLKEKAKHWRKPRPAWTATLTRRTAMRRPTQVGGAREGERERPRIHPLQGAQGDTVDPQGSPLNMQGRETGGIFPLFPAYDIHTLGSPAMHLGIYQFFFLSVNNSALRRLAADPLSISGSCYTRNSF